MATMKKAKINRNSGHANSPARNFAAQPDRKWETVAVIAKHQRGKEAERRTNLFESACPIAIVIESLHSRCRAYVRVSC